MITLMHQGYSSVSLIHGQIFQKDKLIKILISMNAHSLILSLSENHPVPLQIFPFGCYFILLDWSTVQKDKDVNEIESSLRIKNLLTNESLTVLLHYQGYLWLKEQLGGKFPFLKKNQYNVVQKIKDHINVVSKYETNELFVEKSINLSSNDNLDSQVKVLMLESQILSFIKDNPHSNLISLKEINFNNSNFSLIFDFCEGGDLFQMTQKKEQKLKKEEIKLIMTQLLNGLDFLHSKKIIHRDIKLDNIFLYKSNDLESLKIGDFGFATFYEQRFSHLRRLIQYVYYIIRCGTPGYIAPEVFNNNQDYDFKCDIYSAGMILYILLTNESPFPNVNLKLQYIQQSDLKELIHKNKHNLYNKNSLIGIDAIALDLLFQMINLNPLERPSAKQCLQHPFLSEIDQNIKEQSSTRTIVINKPSEKVIQTQKIMKIAKRIQKQNRKK